MENAVIMGDSIFKGVLLDPNENKYYVSRELDWKAIEAEFGVKHLPSDFKKHNGYLRSLQLSEEYGLYRQDYCGCEFSARARGIV